MYTDKRIWFEAAKTISKTIPLDANHYQQRRKHVYCSSREVVDRHRDSHYAALVENASITCTITTLFCTIKKEHFAMATSKLGFNRHILSNTIPRIWYKYMRYSVLFHLNKVAPHAHQMWYTQVWMTKMNLPFFSASPCHCYLHKQAWYLICAPSKMAL